MKRGILCFVLAALFALPTLAAAEVHGVYIAPKFLLGIQDSGQLSRSNTRGPGNEQMFSQHSQAVFGGALAVGYNFAPKFNVPVRTEIEFALRSGSSKSKDASASYTDPVPWTDSATAKHKIQISTLFLNAYFDINTGTPFTPYLGGGLGMAFKYTEAKVDWTEDVPGFFTRSGSESKSKHDTTFAWNLGAGLAYAFTENISADLGYRFVHTGHTELKAGAGADRMKLGSSPYIHEFYLGARFTF